MRQSSYRFIFAACALLVAGVSAPSFAVTARALPDDEQLITVEINKGEMVHMPAAISSVVVSDPLTADIQVVSPKLLFVRGKKVGETSIYAVDGQDNTIFSATVNVTHNISELNRMVKKVAPESDVTFSTVDGGMVMQGTASSPVESENIRDIAAAYIGDKEKMVNMIKTEGSDQVMLQVKVVEMSRNDLKKLGVSLQNVTSNGNFALQLLQGSNILYNTADPTIQAFNTPGSVLYRGTNGADSNFLLKYKTLNGLVDALETDGLATVLAEPTLTTTSGKSASFLAGGQFPIPTVQGGGTTATVTIQYQPFGVSLNFTPIVMSKNRISLTVAPEVSTLDFDNPIAVSGITYPILDTRKASAVVELGSGDSFMLAGLLSSNTSNSISKFPGLGDLPVLGALFRSTQFQNQQTELAILVTPYIVRPVSGQKLQTPVDGYVPPSDLQRALLGNLYQQQPMTPQENLPPLHGDGGFILE